jgi:primosomal protein N' (replication factor Y)
LVGIVSIDHLLNLADFSSSEKIFAQLNRLAGLAKQTLLLQTYHPNNPLLRVALKRDWSAFLKQEISLRQKLALPPFFRLIRLIYQHKNEAKCEKETNLVASKLKALLENFSGKFIVLGPSPCFYAKIKGRYRWQIVLKIPAHQPLPTLLRHFLQRLPRDWILDANPVTIL